MPSASIPTLSVLAGREESGLYPELSLGWLDRVEVDTRSLPELSKVAVVDGEKWRHFSFFFWFPLPLEPRVLSLPPSRRRSQATECAFALRGQGRRFKAQGNLGPKHTIPILKYRTLLELAAPPPPPFHHYRTATMKANKKILLGPPRGPWYQRRRDPLLNWPPLTPSCSR